MQDGDTGGSAPCFARDLVHGHVVDRETWRDVSRFRAAERTRLLALRRAMAPAQREAQTRRVTDALDALLGDVSGQAIAAWWPIRGELDLRGWMAEAHARGARIALPAVVGPDLPLAFRRWAPGCAMVRGLWDIPVPVPDPAEAVAPDIVLVPLLGVDAAGYRLGNGGGYYDMTLAAMPVRPRRIGIGQDFCRVPTIHPQPWDVPMDVVLLGDGRVAMPPHP